MNYFFLYLFLDCPIYFVNFIILAMKLNAELTSINIGWIKNYLHYNFWILNYTLSNRNITQQWGVEAGAQPFHKLTTLDLFSLDFVQIIMPLGVLYCVTKLYGAYLNYQYYFINTSSILLYLLFIVTFLHWTFHHQ